MSFAVLPPEINSARLYVGAGLAPMLDAAAAWDGLADEAGRPVQHDVEFTRRSGHGFDATPGCASRRKSSQIRPDLGAFASFRGGQPRRPQTGQARIPCERSTFSATRICSSRLALAADPEPPLARQVPAVNCRPP